MSKADDIVRAVMDELDGRRGLGVARNVNYDDGIVEEVTNALKERVKEVLEPPTEDQADAIVRDVLDELSDRRGLGVEHNLGGDEGMFHHVKQALKERVEKVLGDPALVYGQDPVTMAIRSIERGEMPYKPKPAWAGRYAEVPAGDVVHKSVPIGFEFKPERLWIWDVYGEVDVCDVFAETREGERVEIVKSSGQLSARAFKDGFALNFEGYLYKGMTLHITVQNPSASFASFKFAFEGSEA